jgi:flavin-binding protein dodecin
MVGGHALGRCLGEAESGLGITTLRRLDWFELVEVRGAIMDGGVAHYRFTLKAGSRLEDSAEPFRGVGL